MTTKWKKNLRRSTLATLITLALTGSAFAMPSGGVVEQGRVDISAGNLVQVGSGATITAQTNSIINWNDFSIAKGELLNFNTAAGALLNRVTSDKVSELLGTMTQTGANPLFVVNPNGIHIGGNASIDAANLTLSTLAMSSGDFNAAASGSNYTLAQGAQGVKAVTIDSGAKIGVGNTLNIYGGKVVVADGVIFNPSDKKTAKKHYALILAGDRAHMWMDPKDGETQPVRVTTTKDNTAEFHGTMNVYNDADIRVVGSSVNLDKAVVSSGGKFEAMAVKQAGYNGNAYREDADATNVLSANGFTGRSGEYSLSGGKVDLKNSSITGSKIEIRGEQDYQQIGDMNRGRAVQVHRAGSDNTVTLNRVTLKQQGGGDYAWFYINGGKVTMKDSALESDVTGNISAAQYTERISNAEKEYEPKSVSDEWRTTKGNALTVEGGTLTGKTKSGDDSFTLTGSTVNLNGTEVDASGSFNVVAAQRMYGGVYRRDVAAVAGNALRTDGVHIKADNMRMFGGNVQLKDSDIQTRDALIHALQTWMLTKDRETQTATVDNALRIDHTKLAVDEKRGFLSTNSGTTNIVNDSAITGANLSFGALHTYDDLNADPDTGEGKLVATTADHKINVWDSSVSGKQYVGFSAGAVGVWKGNTKGSTVTSEGVLMTGGVSHRTDGSVVSLQRDVDSHVKINDVEMDRFKVVSTAPAVPALPKLPDVPVSPMPSVSPAGEDVSASDAENMETGERKARAALDASHNAVERRENLTIQMRELSQKSPNGRASIGVIMGAMQAINKASNISDAEKYALMQTVINADDTTNRMATAQDTTTIVSTEDAVDVATYAEDPMQPLTMSEAEETIIFADKR